MTEPLLYVKDGAIVTITLNLPDQRNPISEPALVDAMVEALDRLEADREAAAAILTGAGSAFSSGGDLRKMNVPGGLGGGRPVETPTQYRTGIQRIPLAFERLQVPIIAAVNGPAIGAGCDLACMCDVRIASTTARFAESFVKVGLIPGDGGAWLLPRIVGYSKAAEMAFTGDALDADAALACGLVSRVVPPQDLLGAARELVGRIARNPIEAVRMTKRLLVRGRGMRLDELLDLSATMQALTHTTDDHREAVAAFLEKRAPSFSGQ